MMGIQKYLTKALAGGLIVAMGYGKLQNMKVATLTAENAVLVSKLATCEARSANLTEDTQSDAEIDAIPDTDLGDVPNRWLRPEKP